MGGEGTSDPPTGKERYLTIAIIGLDGSVYNGQGIEKASPTVPFTKADIIGCHARRIKGDGGNLYVCQLRRNGEMVGAGFLEGDNIYPAVALGSSAEVVANLGGAKFRYTQGIIICIFISKRNKNLELQYYKSITSLQILYL